MQNGIVYTTTGERNRGQVSEYHQKPQPLFLNKTKYPIDIAGLKKADQRAAIKFDGSEYETKFTVGFEIEKNQLHRAAVREYELFCGFERDSSCGYEAVTHVLPLLPAGKWRTKVFDLFHKAEKIIDDRFSPSDRSCGGHITVAADGLTGEELNRKVRGNCGILLALFRNRLNSKYCGSNRRMQDITDPVFNSWTGGSHNYRPTQCHWKYQTALVKGKCLEFRVPSRFESVKQVMRRYELTYEIVNFSVNNPKGGHEVLLSKIAPIILSMYNGDSAKASEVLELARKFRVFILRGEIHTDIKKYLA